MLDPRYRDEFTKRWSKLFSRHLLKGSSTQNQQLISPDAFADYVQQHIQAGSGMDQLVSSLLEAKGSVTPGQQDFNPAASFLVSLRDEKGIAATNRSLELFWGQAAKCAQCHDHGGEGTITKHTYWQVNAHFRQFAVQVYDF